MVSRVRLLSGVLMAVSIGVTGLCAESATALAKGPKGDHEANVESMKKPGKGCEQFKKDSPGYKDCVNAEARKYQHTKGKAKAKGKDKGKGKNNGD